MRGNPNVHPRLRFGYRPDPIAVRQAVPHLHHLLGAPGPLPKSVDHSQAVLDGAGIMDQLTTSSCVGHAIDGSVEARFALIKQKIAHRAPICVYDGARALVRVPNVEGVLPPFTDDGSEPSQGWRGVSLFGICPYADRPTDPATINHEMNLRELQDAATFRLLGQYGVNDTTWPARLLRIKQALAAGYLPSFATFVDNAFQAWQPSKGPLGAPDLTDPNGGGHYLYMCGYDTMANGSTILKFANSWGVKDWGLAGFGEADEAFGQQTTDIYVGHVQKAA